MKREKMHMDNEKERITQTYRDYVQAFQSLEPKAVLPFYHAPFLSLSSREARVMTKMSEIEDSFSRNMEILRQNQYARTDIVKLDVKQMSRSLALISVGLKRYTTSGEPLGGEERTYAYTYTLFQTDHHWKIVAAMAHDPETILNFK
jgi:ketosteroid isomerase-like protein